MRFGQWVVGSLLWAALACEGRSADMREASCETNAWHAVRCVAEPAPEGLALRQEDGAANGFLLPRAAWPRRGAAVEADVRMRARLAKSGWTLAGVALYQDDANFWMLALVEGPDGTHTVDFLENHAGVWQAQGEPKTLLPREGSVSCAWKSGAAYRLRLAFEDGRVTARVTDPADSRVLGSASFKLSNATAAVCSGRPAVIVRGCAASAAGLKFGVAAAAPGGASQASVALLDDALPGHDRAANARLAAALAKQGLRVESLSADEIVSAQKLSADRVRLLVVPQCDALPLNVGSAIREFAREGGQLVFLGGPFLDRALLKVGDAWLDKEGQARLLQDVRPAHRPFEITPALDLKGWRRSCADSRTPSDFRVVSEGPEGAPCLRLDIPELQGWDVRQSPALKELFGEGDTFFTFLGKGDAKTSQLAVEIIERDGSRWIATAALAPEWRRVGLRLDEFRYWKDSSGAKGRGRAGDRLRPRDAVRVCFGLSNSHTAAVGAGTHTIWLADVGTAPDPLAAAAGGAVDLESGIECVYPRYKVYTVGMASEGRVVCAIPRTLGEGLGRGGRWRFVPLREVADRATQARGVGEWLLLNTRFPQEGCAIAGFGYADPAVWSSPAVAARIAETAARLTSGAVFESAGTEQFAYWPGEAVRLGARVRVFGASGEREVTLEVQADGRTVWSEKVKRTFAEGAADLTYVWQPPSAPGEYRFTARLSGATADEISHGFAVLDPAPAPKDAFIAAHDGDFWLGGKKWYPVGVNFWPLYVSGMDREDYGSGWLRDAYYAPALVERDLAHLRDMGINMVSIQTPPQGECRNLLDFLRLCAKYDIHANLYVGLASPLAFNDAELKAYLAAARLPGNPTVFAYDTIWEPGNHVFKDNAARARWDAEWRAWLNERYGSVEKAEKDWGFKARRDSAGRAISPADVHFREDGAWRGMVAAYRRFMDNLTSGLWGRANRRLRELDPSHLVSFRQGNTLPYDFALSGPVKHIDFICPEGYSIRDTDEGEAAIGFITRYVEFTTRGKPVVWSEFGQSVWNNNGMAPDAGAVERQGRYSERFYRTALAAGANGTAPWWWVGGYRVDERSDFGILEPDGRERPSARLIREYGPRLKTPRAKPQPNAWFEFDRDGNAGGYWRAAFSEGAAAYRSAVRDGRMLGVRSAGTGTDSATAPLVAVGNVPCDGANPPKYLDAEFNSLQVLNSDGAWQEAEDGAEIAVAAGQPVRTRASVGNTQEAAWLPSSEKGGVALTARAGGQALGSWAVPVRVPYLSDAVFGEFTLLPAAQNMAVTLRMEAVGRTPFGEARAFTLRAK